MRILFLSPGLRTDEAIQNRLKKWDWISPLLGNDVEVIGKGCEKGSQNSEGDFDDYLAGAEVCKAVMNAKNIDAVVISDTGDPFLHGLREYLDVPVVGPMETSLNVASTLGYKFSIITPAKFMIPRKARQVKAYGFGDKLASIRPAVSSVAEVSKNPEKTIQAVINESNKAIDEDGAEVIIQMCGAMVDYYDDIRNEVHAPVIEPIRTALKYAESLVRLKLTHSKISYPKPSDKVRVF
jgi:allantoin racemase